jgi:hypothetical protein
LNYSIAVKENGKTTTFPQKCNDANPSAAYTTNVVAPTSPIYLFDALTDNDKLARPWNKGLSFVPTGEPGKAEIRINIEKLFSVDAENPNGERIHDYSMRYYFANDVKERASALNSKKEIVFHGRSLNNKPTWVQVAFITRKGSAYGGVIKLDSKSGDYKLSISDLKPVKLVTLPRPYPTFLSYFFESNSTESLNINDIESLQISIGPGIPSEELGESHGLAVESVRLE